MDGFVLCRNGLLLEVTKDFQVRYDNRGRMSVRCYRYRYVGLLPGMNWLLKYHSWHQNPDEYIHRANDPKTGAEAFSETLHRYQFPTFPEVLDELEYLAQNL